MGAKTLIGALVLCVGATAATGEALAEALNLVCHVRETRGAAHRELKRRLDIDLTKKTVSFYDDVGKGWEFKREGPIVSADAERIRLDASDGKESYVDRRTGEYAFHNQRDGVTIRGPCERTTAEKPKF